MRVMRTKRYPHNTERTFRGERFWVKVVRSNATRQYFFYVGFNGCPKAHRDSCVPFSIIRTWYDAECHAVLLQQR
jgi:hypothetical protein